MNQPETIQMPREFMLRFVASRVMPILPSLVGVLVIGHMMNPTNLAWRILGYSLAILLLAFINVPAAKRCQKAFKRLGPDAVHQAMPDTGRGQWIPLFCLILVIGVVLAIVRDDWIWPIIVSIIGGLIPVGLFLQWILFDRWITLRMRASENLPQAS